MENSFLISAFHRLAGHIPLIFSADLRVPGKRSTTAQFSNHRGGYFHCTGQ